MPPQPGENLPIHALRARFDAAIAEEPGNVVVSSPTGSGKSTELPHWCRGRVLVVEPRRIACQSLASRVAELEGTQLGDSVGYVVRDDRRLRAETRIVYATPGIVLRDEALLASADAILLDEFHERSLEGDLLLALLLAQQRHGGAARDRKLVVLSATLEGERVAAFLGGVHLAAEGRAFPVEVRFTETADAAPDGHDLVRRTVRALEASANDPGDVLVFLPGRAEIDAVAAALGGMAADVLPLHGGLALDAQRATFAPRARRKIILATNVAETSLTVPGIGVVIDGGLVRRTHYHAGRGFLALAPIAADSAAQRTGRAGRTAPGISYRLWGPRYPLAASTPPAIHRESLVPLVMASAAFGQRPEDLPFLDPPKAFALAAARDDLRALAALEGGAEGGAGERAGLSAEGRALFALPVEPAHGRLLSEARRRGCLEDAIDLVAALSIGRPLFVSGGPPLDPHDDLRLAGCDVTALVRAIRFGRPEAHGLSAHVLGEARRARGRLRRASGLAESAGNAADLAVGDARDRLVEAAFAADPRTAHLVRSRGAQRTLSNGGTEIDLARDSALGRLTKLDAAIVLETRAFGSGRDAHVLATVCAAIPLAWLVRAGLGEDRVAHVTLERGKIVATVERVFANKVLATREGKPEGAAAREAIATLFLRGSLFKEAAKLTRERLSLGALAAKIAEREGRTVARELAAAPSVEDWVRQKIEALGVESADDLALLSAADLTAPELPWDLAETMAKDYPATVSVGDATYAATYELSPLQVTLKMVRGSRKDPPTLGFLPRFPGLRIVVDGPRGIAVLRATG